MTVEYDPLDPETRRDPHPVYARFASEAPVAACPGPRHLRRQPRRGHPPHAARSRDVVEPVRAGAAVRAGELGCAGRGRPARAHVPAGPHRRRCSGRGSIAGYEERDPGARGSRSLDELAPLGTADLIPTFAEQIPLVVICRLLGFQDAPLDTFRRYTHVRDAGRDGRGRHGGAGATRHSTVRAYFQSEIDRRTNAIAAGEEPPDDLTTQLLVTEIDGRRLSEDVVCRASCRSCSSAAAARRRCSSATWSTT